MRNVKRIAGLLALCLAFAPAADAQRRAATSYPEVDIPYTKTVLDNGLTLIVHEDHKAPIVAVNVWYHVGSKNEPEGRSGFAHLFEHLMFNGSENANDDFFQVLERIGATTLNGTTNEDRTNYFQNVPVSALDTVLWLESDRMGHLLGAIDQAKLDEQRGVVQNEKRQFENQPYAVSYELTTEAVYPDDHPYGHSVIGSMEDLNAASLDDVRDWFQKYYGAANAVVVIAGDITPEVAKQKVEHYFGDIASGPPVARFERWPAKRTGSQRQTVGDRVPQVRIDKVWNVPGAYTREGVMLSLLADVLVSDKASRLYKRLVYDDQTATNVSAYIDAREIGGLFSIEAMVRPGGDAEAVEKAIHEELERLLASGPTDDELGRVRAQHFAGVVRGLERIGGFGGKSDLLARSEVYASDPGAWKSELEWMRTATPAQVQQAGREWLSDGLYTLVIRQFPNFRPAAQGADRSAMPQPGQPPAPQFPAIQTATLSNGLAVVLAERHQVPVVNFSLLVDAGFAADQFAQPGTAALAMGMLDEGTRTRDAIRISTDLARLGATLGSGSNLDVSTVSLSALESNLDASLDLYADVILNPSFPRADFERLQKQQLAQIQREKANPIQLGLRIFPSLLYGETHAYGYPFTGTGTEAAVASLTRDDLARFHQTWFKPNNATIVVVGDTTMNEIRPKLERLFSSWRSGEVPAKNLARVELPPKQRVYLVDKPGAVQSVILGGTLAPPKANPIEPAIEAMNTILGGAFISRLNLNLREDKHWSYGAGTFLPDARAQRPFIAYASVQTDKTKESIQEVVNELRGITADRVVTADEVAMAKANLTLTLPGTWETSNQVAGAIAEIVRFDLPHDYWSQYPGRIRSLAVNDLNRAAVEVVRPGNVTWLIVGDLSLIEKPVRELGLGEVVVLDADGAPAR
ncbi:MAG TPA: pitrilysin family protein [Thermoanaerobaculia bacterium]|nr:pitrilysin family protein [Thermoanaerobaculia bacterium]